MPLLVTSMRRFIKLNRKYLYIVGLIFCLGACFQLFNGADDKAKRWPHLTARPLFSEQTVQYKQAPGQWLFVNIWATWCEPCRKELPWLQILAGKFEQSSFSVQLISIDTDLNLVKEFLLQYHIDLPVYLSSREEVERLLNSTGYPVSYLINPNGQIVKVYSGVKAWHSEDVVKELQETMKSED